MRIDSTLRRQFCGIKLCVFNEKCDIVCFLFHRMMKVESNFVTKEQLPPSLSDDDVASKMF
jgi:hypothetical protein